MTGVRLSTPVRVIIIGVLVLNVVDLALHIATDQVEPLRVTANVVVLLLGILVLTVARTRVQVLAAIGGLVTLALNLIVIATTGLGPAGFVFVFGTVIGLGIVAFLDARRTRTG